MKLDERVKVWVSETGRVCDGSADALAWMGPYGTDYLRAWEECPRADWLVLIAAALGADAEKVFDVACEVSLGAVEQLPIVLDWPRRAVARAMGRRRSAVRLSSCDRETSDAILDASERELRPLPSPATRFAGPLGAELRSWVVRSLGPSPERDLPSAVRRACEAVAGAHESHAVLIARREDYFREQQALLLAHATTAAGACLVGASVSTGFVTSPRARTGSPHVPRELSSSARFRRDTLLVEAHRAILHASCASGRALTAARDAWDEGTFAYASGLVAYLLISPEGCVVDGEVAATRERQVALERRLRCAVLDAQHDLAERLRAAIPFASLLESGRARRPQSRVSARAVLGNALLQLRSSATTAIDTLESVRESLDAPCPPSSRTLLPILTSLREQLSSNDEALDEAIDRTAALHAERIVARSPRADERSAN